MPIFISPKTVLTVVGSVAGAVGVGYGVRSVFKRQTNQTNDAKVSERPKNMTEAVSQPDYGMSNQADAVVVDVVNAVRINRLLGKLAEINRNSAGAEIEIQQLKAEVQKILTSNRGGDKGIHGFIGETSQVHISNIKAFINGEEPLYILLDDNSMTDYTRGLQIIQQKACKAGGHLGLDAIKRHMDKYPEFVEQGGIYQIPKDMYARYTRLKDLPEEVAMKLRKEDVRLWKYIRSFTNENPKAVIEPMEVSYTEIQAGSIDGTVKQVEERTEKEFDNQRQNARNSHVPTFEEFLKVCGISAAIEGGVSAGMELVSKLKGGKKFTEFTKQDFKDIGAKFAIGSGKGALRGGIVYIATNLYKIPAAAISGIVTAMFGVCREGYLFARKKITKTQLAQNSIFVILETAASAGGAAIGKHLCKKHPIIGALVGSLAGSTGIGCLRKVAFA